MNKAYTPAIKANIEALARLLENAASQAKEAAEAIEYGERNLAIGCIIDLEHILPAAQALYGAAIALHRQQ